jgi:aspartyl-tRNA(Asn)/glutamyl-tRNA(Gln) amidotransferase subunit A
MLLSWSLDSIGPLARSVEDCALLLNALAAPDPRDPTTLGQPLEDFTLSTRGGSVEGMRIALPEEAQLPDFMHADVTKSWHAAARTFEDLGAVVETVRLPSWYFDLSRPAGTIIASEAYSLHRDYIDDPKWRSVPACAPCAGGQGPAGRRLCRGNAPHGSSAGASSTPGSGLRRHPDADRGGAGDPAVGSRGDLAHPGYLTRTRELSRPVRPGHALGPVGRLPLGVQIVASRSPSATCCGSARRSRTPPTSTSARPTSRRSASSDQRCGMPWGTMVSTIEASSAS